jgi:hypothetical protein
LRHRIVRWQPAILAWCFVLSVAPASGADKVKIEIVEAVKTIQMLDTASGQIPHLMFSAKVILPDGSHAELSCIAGDNGCARIEPMVGERSSSNCETAGNITTCTTRHLGIYPVKRDKNYLTIYGPAGKLKYHIIGSW